MSKLSFSPFSTPSPQLAHFNRLLSSSGGTDRVFMLACYSAKVFNYILSNPRYATKNSLDIALRITKLGAVISDARVLYRLFGLFPIIGWMQSMHDPKTAPKDAILSKIEYLQGLSMLCYYPLEHIYYLATKGVFDIAPATIGRMARISCRFWAAYVFLQLGHIYRQKALLTAARQAVISNRVKKVKEASVMSEEDAAAERAEVARIAKADQRVTTDLMVQLGYLPLTVNWSLENGILPDPVYVGVFGSIAAAFGLVGVWRATA